MAEHLRFYLDEDVPVQVAAQLRLRGIDVVTARDLNMLGDTDENHLERATALGRILCTYDPYLQSSFIIHPLERFFHDSPNLPRRYPIR